MSNDSSQSLPDRIVLLLVMKGMSTFYFSFYSYNNVLYPFSFQATTEITLLCVDTNYHENKTLGGKFDLTINNNIRTRKKLILSSRLETNHFHKLACLPPVFRGQGPL